MKGLTSHQQNMIVAIAKKKGKRPDDWMNVFLSNEYKRAFGKDYWKE